MGVGDLSRRNSIRILEQLLRDGPTSRTDLSRRLNLAPATVNRLTGRLADDGLVKDTGSMAVTGGRPSRLLDFNREYRLLMTVDIADHHTSVALADLSGRLLERWDFPTDGPCDVRYSQVFQHVGGVTDALGDRRALVTSLGVSVPGPVDDTGVVLFAPALGWHMKPLRRDLEGVSRVPVVVENDANLIALAEQSSGRWGTVRSLVAIAVFEGIGSGIIEDGRLWRGASGAAGQIGRLLVEKDSLSNEYTGFGYFESQIGASNLVHRARKIGVTTLTPGRPLDADQILSRYSGGDLAARGLVNEVLDEFAVSLVNVCALLAPEVIVFSGLFDRWGSVLLPGLRERLRGHVVHLPVLAPSAVGADGALVGAALLAFESAGAVPGLLPEDA